MFAKLVLLLAVSYCSAQLNLNNNYDGDSKYDNSHGYDEAGYIGAPDSSSEPKLDQLRNDILMECFGAYFLQFSCYPAGEFWKSNNWCQFWRAHLIKKQEEQPHPAGDYHGHPHNDDIPLRYLRVVKSAEDAVEDPGKLVQAASELFKQLPHKIIKHPNVQDELLP